MRLSSVKHSFLGDTTDDRPGAYYVSVVDGDHFGLLLGPFATHREALAHVDAATDEANRIDPKAAWYSFGTCRLERPVGPGILNDHLLNAVPESLFEVSQ